jgi:hypothetical protein
MWSTSLVWRPMHAAPPRAPAPSAGTEAGVRAPLAHARGARRLRSVRLRLQPRCLAAMKRGARSHPRHTAVVHLHSLGFGGVATCGVCDGHHRHHLARCVCVNTRGGCGCSWRVACGVASSRARPVWGCHTARLISAADGRLPNEMSSDGDSSDEEERARVRARLASKLGQAPKADAWLELESCLRALDVAKLVEEARGGLVHLKDVVPHPYASPSPSVASPNPGDHLPVEEVALSHSTHEPQRVAPEACGRRG